MRLTFFLLLTLLFSSVSLFAQPGSEQHPVVTEPFRSSLQASVQPKSALVGAALSLLLPGMGEVYAGNFQSGRYFLGAEIAMLLGIGTQYVRGSSFESDYKVLARTNAGVSGDKDEQFWRDISSFSSIDDFNADRLRNRDFGRLYNPQTHFWQWNSEVDRRQFRDLRIQSDKAYQSIYYFFAAMGINRVLSMINAVRGINAFNETHGFSNDDGLGTSLYFLPEHRTVSPIPDGIRAEFRVGF
ncbi:MAG: hypothetical protein ACK4XY_02545 [Chloroherpetonaceae bacterium]